MRKIICVLIFVVACFTSIYDINAFECKYPDVNLTITYDKDNVSVNSDFVSSDYAVNLLGVVKWGGRQYTTSEIIYPQELYEKYKGECCPDKMILCEYTENSFGNSFSLLESLTSEEQYALLKVDNRKLYIMTYDEYKKSDLKKYTGNNSLHNYSVLGSEHAVNGYENCSDGSNNGFSIAAGVVCGYANWVWNNALSAFSLQSRSLFSTKFADCTTVNYDGPGCSFNANCGKLTTNLLEYKEEVDKYKGCGDRGCKIKSISSLNKKENDLKAVCKSMFENYDYNDTQGECLETCLKLKSELNSYRQGTDLYIDYTNVGDSCEIAENIIAMVYNVLKWAKYIAPALVIILSMLDFIKAIASQSDDEMKKAQGKFVKRLIVAALLFLLPFIINFMLKTFGIYNSKCDVNNLFSSSK